MVFLALILNRIGLLPAIGLEATGTAVLLIGLLLTCSIMMGWLFGRLFEAHTGEFRDRLFSVPDSFARGRT